MIKVFQLADSLAEVRREQAALRLRKDQLERDAWATAPETIRRATQLLADATIALFGRYDSVPAAALLWKVESLAGERDRHAVLLCRSWLAAPDTKRAGAQSATPRRWPAASRARTCPTSSTWPAPPPY